MIDNDIKFGGCGCCGSPWIEVPDAALGERSPAMIDHAGDPKELMNSCQETR
jgi:hypothetical protein